MSSPEDSNLASRNTGLSPAAGADDERGDRADLADVADLAELAAALTADRAWIERAVEAGRVAWTWRTVDAELAELTRDSHGPVGDFALARDDGGRRRLVFRGSTGSVEVEVTDGRIIGQLVPPVSGRVELLVPDGPGSAVLADEVGCFTLDLPLRGLWRLRCTRDTDSLVTTWIDS